MYLGSTRPSKKEAKQSAAEKAVELHISKSTPEKGVELHIFKFTPDDKLQSGEDIVTF